MSIIKYESGEVSLDARIEDGQAWLTYEQVAALFNIDRTGVVKHARQIVSEGELTAATCECFAQVRIEGIREVTRSVDYLNQDMVLHIGYRVRSERGVEFRRWATSVLNGKSAPLAVPSDVDPITALQFAQAEAIKYLAARQAETQRIVNDTAARVVHLEDYKRLADAEVEAAFALPPASVEVSGETDGQRTVTLLKAWAVAHGGAFCDAHRLLYQDVLSRPETRIDLRARLENAKKNRARGEREKRLCDVIDETGKAAEIYAIAIKRFRARVA